MARKPILLDLIERAYTHEQELVAGLSEEERSRAGTLDEWSAKDVLAHIAFWKHRRAQELDAVAQGGTPSRDDDIDHENARVFEEFRDRPWADVLDLAETAHASLIAQVETLTEEDLGRTEVFAWDDRPLWRLIAGNGYVHPLLHLLDYHYEQGEDQRVDVLNEEMARVLPELDESPSWHGVIRYNLACHYSLSGQTVEAIETLREALRLNPELTEWSKEDPDFEPIRDEPAYQSIYTE